MKMFKQNGVATITAIAVISTAFAAGILSKYIFDKKNHPVEQVAECVLEEYGLDYDFSAGKRTKTRGE